MKLSIKNSELIVKLGAKEKVLSVRRSFGVPLKNIKSAHDKRPPTLVWREWRFPGTFFPCLVKAGTYYTPRGQEFWCFRRNDQWIKRIRHFLR